MTNLTHHIEILIIMEASFFASMLVMNVEVRRPFICASSLSNIKPLNASGLLRYQYSPRLQTLVLKMDESGRQTTDVPSLRLKFVQHKTSLFGSFTPFPPSQSATDI